MGDDTITLTYLLQWVEHGSLEPRKKIYLKDNMFPSEFISKITDPKVKSIKCFRIDSGEIRSYNFLRVLMEVLRRRMDKLGNDKFVDKLYYADTLTLLQANDYKFEMGGIND